jgi:translation initiation factor 3 subunit C
MAARSSFWQQGSESESDSESGSDDSIEAPVAAQERFKRTISDESSSDDDRKVRSEKDKRFDALANTIRQINNALKINDWNAVTEEFNKLLKFVLTLYFFLGH